MYQAEYQGRNTGRIYAGAFVKKEDAVQALAPYKGRGYRTFIHAMGTKARRTGISMSAAESKVKRMLKGKK